MNYAQPPETDCFYVLLTLLLVEDTQGFFSGVLSVLIMTGVVIRSSKQEASVPLVLVRLALWVSRKLT